MEDSTQQKSRAPELKVSHRTEPKPPKPLNKQEQTIYYKAQVDALYNVIKIMSGNKP